MKPISCSEQKLLYNSIFIIIRSSTCFLTDNNFNLKLNQLLSNDNQMIFLQVAFVDTQAKIMA